MDTINLEVESARKYDAHDWNTNVNKDNFNTLHQVEMLSERTERFVSALEVQPDQAELKNASLEMIKKGKNLIHERMKVIRFADRDGWKAALHFVGDDIAESVEEAKRMRKSKKETDKEKESARRGNGRDRESRDWSSHSASRQGSSRDREPWGSRNHSNAVNSRDHFSSLLA